MTSSLYGDSPSEAYRLKEANARITQLEATLAIQVKDEAEQDTAIRDIVRKIIGSSVDGDSYGVPPLCDVVEAALAAAAVQVPEEVLSAAHRMYDWHFTPMKASEISSQPYFKNEDGLEQKDVNSICNFILQIAKKGR